MLRREGYEAAVVEKWLPHLRRRLDLFGVIDILAVRARGPVLAVQATTGSNGAARLKKAVAEPRLAVWLAAGQRFEVWAWSKRGSRGKRKKWIVTRITVTEGDVTAAAKNAAPPPRLRRLILPRRLHADRKR